MRYQPRFEVSVTPVQVTADSAAEALGLARARLALSAQLTVHELVWEPGRWRQSEKDGPLVVVVEPGPPLNAPGQ